MTTQDAGRGTRESSSAGAGDNGGAAIDFDEAERLASQIRPAWELEAEGEDPGSSNVEPAAASAAAAEPPPAPAGSSTFTSEASLPPTHETAPARPSTPSDVRTSAGSASLLPRDTVIDGAPTVGVGSGAADPSAPAKATRVGFADAIAEGIAIVDRGAASSTKATVMGLAAPAPAPAAPEPPRRAGPTRLGVGDDPSEITTAMPVGPGLRSAAEASAAAEASVAEANPGSLDLPEPALKFGGTIRMDASPLVEAARHPSSPPPAQFPSSPPPARESSRPSAAVARGSSAARLSPVEPQGASYSKADDPIEIPVQTSSKTLLYLVGGALAVGAIVGGVVLFGGSSDPKTEKKSDDKAQTAAATTATSNPTQAAAPAEPTARATATATAAPTATETASAAATTSATATATASASATATAKETATPTSKPSTTHTASPPTTSKPPTPKNTGTTPSKPPPSGNGGIIRDTPF